MSHELLSLLPFAGYGAVGGLICSMAKTRTLTLPKVLRRREADGETYTAIDLGFLAAPLLGALAAMLCDGRPVTGIAWGGICGYAGPAVLNFVLDPWLRKLGIPVYPSLVADVVHEVLQQEKAQAPKGETK